MPVVDGPALDQTPRTTVATGSRFARGAGGRHGQRAAAPPGGSLIAVSLWMPLTDGRHRQRWRRQDHPEGQVGRKASGRPDPSLPGFSLALATSSVGLATQERRDI